MERPKATAAGSAGRDEPAGKWRGNQSEPQAIRHAKAGLSRRRTRPIAARITEDKHCSDLGWLELKYHTYNGEHRNAQSVAIEEFVRSTEPEGRTESKRS